MKLSTNYKITLIVLCVIALVLGFSYFYINRFVEKFSSDLRLERFNLYNNTKKETIIKRRNKNAELIHFNDYHIATYTYSDIMKTNVVQINSLDLNNEPVRIINLQKIYGEGKDGSVWSNRVRLTDLIITPDSRYLILLIVNSKVINIFDIENNKHHSHINRPNGTSSIKISKHGRYLVANNIGKGIVVYKLYNSDGIEISPKYKWGKAISVGEYIITDFTHCYPGKKSNIKGFNFCQYLIVIINRKCHIFDFENGNFLKTFMDPVNKGYTISNLSNNSYIDSNGNINFGLSVRTKNQNNKHITYIARVQYRPQKNTFHSLGYHTFNKDVEHSIKNIIFYRKNNYQIMYRRYWGRGGYGENGNQIETYDFSKKKTTPLLKLNINTDNFGKLLMNTNIRNNNYKYLGFTGNYNSHLSGVYKIFDESPPPPQVGGPPTQPTKPTLPQAGGPPPPSQAGGPPTQPTKPTLPQTGGPPTTQTGPF